jgi:ParB-like chromosome segregation protein Spo0J
VDSQPALPEPEDDAGTRLLRRIEAIAADIEGTPHPPALAGSVEGLATRLEAAFDVRLAALEEAVEGLSERLEALGRENAAELAALREDLADALEQLSAGLMDRLSQLQAGIGQHPSTGGPQTPPFSHIP